MGHKNKKNKIVSFQLFSLIKRANFHNSGIEIHRMYPGKVLNACSYYYKAVKPMICDTEMVSIVGLYYLLLSLFEPTLIVMVVAQTIYKTIGCDTKMVYNHQKYAY